MASPFLAEIRVVGFNFPPKGWAFCNGALLTLSQNTALFSLVGTMYGGDGKSTFGLPNIEGQAVVGSGQSTTGTFYDQGGQYGVPTVTLTQGEMAAHTHSVMAVPDPADQTSPSPIRSLARSKPTNAYQTDAATGSVMMNPQDIVPIGGDLPHNNMPPVQVLNYVIALQGIFPPRS
jgi:microcystin-dependent protein